ncbi:DUF4136 domain-containing protein [uncultured Vibrio sp.]|uniref:DUF4136 domain-containing protein n=1 Tax=uncultured Vibrio sp. TaxID=114054 RepID=UPI002609B561|nr:DUF4136 domain-containing protein [uncultured Vibrio sp.]
MTLITMGLAGCSAQQVPATLNYGVVTSGDLDFMKNGVVTYSWHPKSEQIYLSQKYDKTVITDLVRDAIQEQLSNKGYQFNQDHGDVVVGFGLAQNSEFNDDAIFDAINLSTGVEFYASEGKQAEKGSLYIAFFVPNSDTRLWQALAQSDIQPKLSPSETKQRIKGYVGRLFSGMPER